MFPWCLSKPADFPGSRSSIAKLLLGVFVVYALHTAWLLYGFLHTKPCDGSTGEHCITSYLTARARLQVSTGLAFLVLHIESKKDESERVLPFKGFADT